MSEAATPLFPSSSLSELSAQMQDVEQMLAGLSVRVNELMEGSAPYYADPERWELARRCLAAVGDVSGEAVADRFVRLVLTLQAFSGLSPRAGVKGKLLTRFEEDIRALSAAEPEAAAFLLSCRHRANHVPGAQGLSAGARGLWVALLERTHAVVDAPVDSEFGRALRVLDGWLGDTGADDSPLDEEAASALLAAILAGDTSLERECASLLRESRRRASRLSDLGQNAVVVLHHPQILAGWSDSSYLHHNGLAVYGQKGGFVILFEQAAERVKLRNARGLLDLTLLHELVHLTQPPFGVYDREQSERLYTLCEAVTEALTTRLGSYKAGGFAASYERLHPYVAGAAYVEALAQRQTAPPFAFLRDLSRTSLSQYGEFLVERFGSEVSARILSGLDEINVLERELVGLEVDGRGFTEGFRALSDEVEARRRRAEELAANALGTQRPSLGAVDAGLETTDRRLAESAPSLDL